MLHDLQECAQRGVPIIVFNPLRERGFERFTNPQSPVEMLSGKSTPISSQYHQASLIKVHAERKWPSGHCLIEREVKPRRLPPPELPAKSLARRGAFISHLGCRRRPVDERGMPDDAAQPNDLRTVFFTTPESANE